MTSSPFALFATEEGKRLAAARASGHWRMWGPYLSERQWGTVREDYSANGDSWGYFTHDHARSRAYRWGEDGIGGFGDRRLRWCLSLALWNGRDDILKERLFGLTNQEGNHGEDVKECYYYLDGVPTHSYMRMLYKYPQGAFPYHQLLDENARRGYDDPEYELTDTGIFDERRYFDVVIEYAKGWPEDILMKVTIANRGPEKASLHVLPQLWARNRWEWKGLTETPVIRALSDQEATAHHPEMPDMRLYVGQPAKLLFCDNETNRRRFYGELDAVGPFKDGINDYVVSGREDAIRAEGWGTKCAAHHRMDIEPGQRKVVWLRFAAGERLADPFGDCDAIMAARRAEADEFYAVVQNGVTDPDARLVQRQAFAGMLWSKQFYNYNVRYLADGRPGRAPAARRALARPQQRLAAYAQRRHHFDARQVGVSLVCLLGSRFPQPAYRCDRPGFRQGAAPASGRRQLHASERPDPGL